MRERIASMAAHWDERDAAAIRATPIEPIERKETGGE